MWYVYHSQSWVVNICKTLICFKHINSLQCLKHLIIPMKPGGFLHVSKLTERWPPVTPGLPTTRRWPLSRALRSPGRRLGDPQVEEIPKDPASCLVVHVSTNYLRIIMYIMKYNDIYIYCMNIFSLLWRWIGQFHEHWSSWTWAVVFFVDEPLVHSPSSNSHFLAVKVLENLRPFLSYWW